MYVLRNIRIDSFFFTSIHLFNIFSLRILLHEAENEKQIFV